MKVVWGKIGKDGGAAETPARTCEDGSYLVELVQSREVGHVTSYQYYHAALNTADDRFHKLDDQEEGVRSGPNAVLVSSSDTLVSGDEGGRRT